MEEQVKRALQLTFERDLSSYPATEAYRVEIIKRLRAGLEAWMPGLPVQPFRDLARQMHREGWSPSVAPRGCGCLGCRIYSALREAPTDTAAFWRDSATRLAASLPDDIRAAGWMLLLHQDTADGVQWMFCKRGTSVRIQAPTDREALDLIRAELREIGEIL